MRHKKTKGERKIKYIFARTCLFFFARRKYIFARNITSKETDVRGGPWTHYK